MYICDNTVTFFNEFLANYIDLMVESNSIMTRFFTAIGTCRIYNCVSAVFTTIGACLMTTLYATAVSKFYGDDDFEDGYGSLNNNELSIAYFIAESYMGFANNRYFDFEGCGVRYPFVFGWLAFAFSITTAILVAVCVCCCSGKK